MSTIFEQSEVIDPTVNPELANKMARQFTEPGKSTTPLMQAPPTNVVSLPGGYLDADNNLHTEARIREITGIDEEALARELRNPNFTIPKVVDLILRRTVQSIGPEPVTPEVLGRLLVGDRSALLLAVRIVTFGSDWEVPDFPCRLCNQTSGVVIELDKDIAVRKLANQSTHEITVPLRNGHDATVALMTGAVQLLMTGDGNRTLPEEQTIAIDQCIRTLDGTRVNPPVAQQMGMGDRHKIIAALTEHQPGPQLEEVSVQCSNCQGTAKYTVGLVDLFR